MPLLEIDNLQVSYGAIQALNGLSLNVEQGELVALIGANGAGKSTTLGAISGVVRPRSGAITYAGQRLGRMASHLITRSGIAHCPEGRHVFPTLTVAENLRLGAIHRRDRDGIVADQRYVFDLFPVLAERRTQIAATLSGGEQQMLAIGRALMSRPRLLLLDEPSLGLAPKLVARIFEVIRELKRRGVTMLLVEQNARQALDVADRAYVLETGRVVLHGRAEELRTNPLVEAAYLGG